MIEEADSLAWREWSLLSTDGDTAALIELVSLNRVREILCSSRLLVAHLGCRWSSRWTHRALRKPAKILIGTARRLVSMTSLHSKIFRDMFAATDDDDIESAIAIRARRSYQQTLTSSNAQGTGTISPESPEILVDPSGHGTNKSG